jgi:hypothetical protein
VREPCGVARDDADARAAIASTGDLLDPTVIKTSGGRRFIFSVHLSEFSASA